MALTETPDTHAPGLIYPGTSKNDDNRHVQSWYKIICQSVPLVLLVHEEHEHAPLFLNPAEGLALEACHVPEGKHGLTKSPRKTYSTEF